MTGSPERPLLFLDVDGPLIPFGASPSRPRILASGSEAALDHENPLLDRLDRTLGPRLMALGCDLMWASTWGDEANEAVAPRVGLPRLPVVEWPSASTDEGPRGLHWKTRHLVERAGSRPFIWVDDEISATDRLWVEAQFPGPSLLHRVDAKDGLTDADFAALAAWLHTALLR